MILSGTSLIRMEEVCAANPAAWFQAYLPGEPDASWRCSNGSSAPAPARWSSLLDTPVAGNRENNIRAGFSTPLRPSLRLAWQGITHPRWLFGTFAAHALRHGMPHFEN